ncbi:MULTISPECIES: NAD-dependent epimerase/dehydratase family protein [unclassified Isoptericola]|uniref:NAD-dependent epimerase/dehydratase family protein n=1 Tax=unclassified Isoptericola TaxID=2623355 RepID=UPI003660B7E7
MSAASLLLVGGTGVISGAVAREAVKRGLEVVALTRGRSGRPLPEGVEHVVADVHDPEATRSALAGRRFDVAVSFVAYSAEDVRREVDALGAVCDQLVMMSTCSVYERPARTLPIAEHFPRSSPRFDYPAGKIDVEDELWRLEPGAPCAATVVRAAHVYDELTLPLLLGWTAVERFRRGAPVVVHGDGTSLWNLLHARDFATGVLPLLGDPAAFGRTFQVTAPDPVSWDEIHRLTAAAAGVPDPWLVHRSSEDIAAEIDWMGLVCAEDFGHSVVYDLSRLLAVNPGWRPQVGLAEGLAETVRRLDARPGRRPAETSLEEALDRLCAGRTRP